jgi:hypothetical protein
MGRFVAAHRPDPTPSGVLIKRKSTHETKGR